jgi:hypothetical protein
VPKTKIGLSIPIDTCSDERSFVCPPLATVSFQYCVRVGCGVTLRLQGRVFTMLAALALCLFLIS